MIIRDENEVFHPSKTTPSSMKEYADISTLKSRMVEAVKKLIKVAKNHRDL